MPVHNALDFFTSVCVSEWVSENNRVNVWTTLHYFNCNIFQRQRRLRCLFALSHQGLSLASLHLYPHFSSFQTSSALMSLYFILIRRCSGLTLLVQYLFFKELKCLNEWMFWIPRFNSRKDFSVCVCVCVCVCVKTVSANALTWLSGAHVGNKGLNPTCIMSWSDYASLIPEFFIKSIRK